MMLRLQNYHFTIQYKNRKKRFVADTLSRSAPSDGTESPSAMTHDVFRVDLTQMGLSPNLVKHGTMDQIIERLWMTLNKVVLGGWPSQKREEPDEIRAYWVFRDEI